MILQKLKSLLVYKARLFGHYRFEEPVLVFESDDWGKVAGKEDGIYPPEFGNRTEWSYDKLENVDELEALYALLEYFKNDFERVPVFTANFIISNPDFKKTIQDDYKKLYLSPIDLDFPQLHKKYIEGLERQVIFPQYHGRLHHNVNRYLKALQGDAKTRFLFNQGINGGLENFEETQHALYSEYFDWENQEAIADFNEWIKTGLQDFKRIFGVKSESMVAPNYVLHPKSIKEFKNADIKYLQAGNKLIFRDASTYQYHNYCLGHKVDSDLYLSVRNLKFEPCRKEKALNAQFAIKQAMKRNAEGHVIVVDTHRFNYVSDSAAYSRQELSTFLSAMRSIKGLRILTTLELGEAIANQGAYTDVFTGAQKFLTPRDSVARSLARKIVQ